jgi:hypothetical protein
MKGQLFRLPLLPVLEKRTYPDLHWPRIMLWQVVAPWNQLRVPLLDPCSEGRGGNMTRELHVYDHASAMIALLFVSPNGTVEAFVSPRSAGFLHSSQSGERPGQAAVHYPQKQNPADCGVFRFSAPDSGDRGGPRPSERAF